MTASRKFLPFVIYTLIALCPSAEAQQAKKIYRIGYLTNASEPRKDFEETFQKSLRERGYVDEQNLFIDWRFSKGRIDQLPQLATELISLKPDCIVALGIAP